MKLLEREKLILSSILLLALGLRLFDIDFLLPYFEYGPDERIFIDDALRILQHGDFHPRTFLYGPLLTYFNALVFLLFFIVLSIGQGGLGNLGPLISGATFSSHHFALLYLGRLGSLVFGLGAILLTHVIARRLWKREAGYLAACFLAINPFHIFISQLMKVDSLLLFEILLALYFSMKIMEEGRLTHYLWAGVCSGLAFSTKYLFPAFFPVIAAHLVSGATDRPGGRSGRSFTGIITRLLNYRLILSLYFCLFTFMLASPYILLDFPHFIRDMQTANLFAQQTATFHLPDGSWWYSRYLYQLFFLFPLIFGPFLYLAAIGGTVPLAKKRPAQAALLLALPVGYLLISGAVSRLMNFQYQLPMLPFTIFLASYLLARLFSKSTRAARMTGLLVIAGAIGWSASNLVVPHVKSLFSTYEAAGRWMDQNLTKSDRVVTYFWVFRPTERLQYPGGKSFWYPQKLDLEHFISLDPDWAVLTHSAMFDDPRWRERFESYSILFHQLRSGIVPGYRVSREFRPGRLWSGFAKLVYPDLGEFRITVIEKEKIPEQSRTQRR